MPTVTQGNTADVAITGDCTLYLHSGNGWARVNFPVGTPIWEGRHGVLPLKMGVARITAVLNSVYYQLSTENVTDDLGLRYVSSALSFVPAVVGPVVGRIVTVTLVSDGSNVPTFPGFDEWASSFGYDNTQAGLVNVVRMWYDGVAYRYEVSQPAVNTPIPIPGTPPAAIRLISTTNLTESGDGTAGWNYVGATAAGYSSQIGVGDKSLAADGHIYYALGSYVAADAGPMWGLDATNAAVTFTSMDFAVYPDTTNVYRIVQGGTAAAAGNTVAVTALDVVRMRRAGSTLFAEVSKDGGNNFTLIHQFSNTSSATLWPVAQITNMASALNLRGVGVA